MSVMDTLSIAGPTSVKGRAFSFLLSFWSHVQTQLDARRTRKALHALNDRELLDIGLSRGDIELIVAQK